VDQGQNGAIFTGFLKLLIPFILVLPGVIVGALYPNLPKPKWPIRVLSVIRFAARFPGPICGGKALLSARALPCDPRVPKLAGSVRVHRRSGTMAKS
jgi:hypothetical protein